MSLDISVKVPDFNILPDELMLPKQDEAERKQKEKLEIDTNEEDLVNLREKIREASCSKAAIRASSTDSRGEG